MNRHERRRLHEQLKREAVQLGGLGTAKGLHACNPDTPWERADESWFAANPTRSHRLRRSQPGEWPKRVGVPPPRCETFTLVRQLYPGGRLERRSSSTPKTLSSNENTEPAAHAMFDAVVNGTMPVAGDPAGRNRKLPIRPEAVGRA